MAASSPAPANPVDVTIEISSIRVTGFEKSLIDPDCQIQINTHNDSFHTRSIRSEKPHWPDCLKFVVPTTCVVEIRLVRKHTIGESDILGHVSVPVQEHIESASKEFELGPLPILALPSHPRKPCESIHFKLKVTAPESASAKAKPGQELIDRMQDDVTRIKASSIDKRIDAAGKVLSVSDLSIDDGITDMGSEIADSLFKANGYLDKWIGIVNQVAAITPYSAAAVGVLKLAYEAWQAQRERDAKVAELSKTIAELWEFMNQDPSLDKVKAVQTTVTGMLQQTTECAKFIRGYVTSTNTGVRLARNLFSNNNSSISDFQDSFAKLKIDYLNGINVATIVTLEEMTDKLDLMQKTLERLVAQTNLQSSQQAAAAVVCTGVIARPLHQTIHGRDSYITSIVDSVSGNKQAWIPILGPAGIGKSAIALAIVNHPTIVQLHKERRHFLPCEEISTKSSSASATQFVELLAKHLGITLYATDPLDDLARGLRSQSQTTCILVLDNFDRIWNESTSPQIKPVLDQLASIPNLTLIMAMTGSSAPEGIEWSFEPEEVPKLPLDAARAIFHDKYPLEADSHLDALLEELGLVPLTIKLVAAAGKSSHLPASTLLNNWKKQHADASGVPGSTAAPLSSIDQSILLSLQSSAMTANPDASRLLSAIALLPSGAQISKLPELVPRMTDMDATVNALLTASLASKDEHGTLTLSVPVRSYVLAHLPADPTLRLNIYSYYYRLALEWSGAISRNAFPSIQEGVSQEQVNMEEVLQQAFADKGDEAAVQAAICYTDFLQFTRAKTGIILFAIDVARRAPYPDLLAYCLQRFGEIGYIQGKDEESIAALEEARAQFLKSGNAEAAAQCLLTLANWKRVRSWASKARPMFETAQAEFVKVGSRSGAAQCTRRLAEMQYIGSDTTEEENDAKAKLQGAREEFIAVGDRRGALQCLQMIGRIEFVGQQQLEKGQATLEEALKGFTEIGDGLGRALCFHNLGNGFEKASRYKEAVPMFEKARDAYMEIGDHEDADTCSNRVSKLSA